MNFFQKFRDFVASPSHSRTMGFLGILAFVGIISLTVVVAQQQQNLKQKAAEPAEPAEPTALSCTKVDMGLPICDRDQDEGANCNQTNSKCRAINDQGQWDIRICQKQ